MKNFLLVLLGIGLTLGLCVIATVLSLGLQKRFLFGDGGIVLIGFVSMFIMVILLNVVVRWVIKRRKMRYEEAGELCVEEAERIINNDTQGENNG